MRLIEAIKNAFNSPEAKEQMKFATYFDLAQRTGMSISFFESGTLKPNTETKLNSSNPSGNKSELNSNDYIDYMQGLDKFDPRSANFVPRNTDSAGSESRNPLQGNP